MTHIKKFLLIVFIFLSAGLFAQRFNGGMVVGMNVSQIDGDAWAGYNKAGLVAGAYIFTKFNNNWGSQLEIVYSSKGSAQTINNPSNRKIRLQYIELPILATYDFSEKFQAHAGASIGYMFSAAQNDGYGYEEFEQFDKFGVEACIGIKYNIFDNLGASFRFSYSVVPIYAQYSGATGEYAMYNNVLTFSIYFRIGNRY
jgi:hypothetical protein